MQGSNSNVSEDDQPCQQRERKGGTRTNNGKAQKKYRAKKQVCLLNTFTRLQWKFLPVQPLLSNAAYSETIIATGVQLEYSVASQAKAVACQDLQSPNDYRLITDNYDWTRFPFRSVYVSDFLTPLLH